MPENRANVSLCWTCKFGMCIREQENQRVVAEQPQFGDGLDENPFDMDAGEPYTDMPDDSAVMEERVQELTFERVNAICYWKPQGETGLPVRVAAVKECNQYEAKDGAEQEDT